MNHGLQVIVTASSVTGVGVLGLAAALSILPKVGGTGRRISEALIRAPLLDLVVAMLTWIPWVVGCVVAGWLGLLGAVVGESCALLIWVFVHELVHRRQARGPGIARHLNKTRGRWRNHFALWVTLIGLPVLWVIRITEYIGYPWLVWVLQFPRYKQGEWVNVSRHKFDGLIGHDLIWCLYCDWMTGVYSLGAEMLRNVESFWCPIRFYDGKKCENCRMDFPDIDRWVPADGTMADVQRMMEEKYPKGQAAWFGHPVRLTVDGEGTGELRR